MFTVEIFSKLDAHSLELGRQSSAKIIAFFPGSDTAYVQIGDTELEMEGALCFSRGRSLDLESRSDIVATPFEESEWRCITPVTYIHVYTTYT